MRVVLRPSFENLPLTSVNSSSHCKDAICCQLETGGHRTQDMGPTDLLGEFAYTPDRPQQSPF